MLVCFSCFLAGAAQTGGGRGRQWSQRLSVPKAGVCWSWASGRAFVLLRRQLRCLNEFAGLGRLRWLKISGSAYQEQVKRVAIQWETHVN